MITLSNATGMWDELTDLYVEQGRVSDLVDALQSAADRVSATDERVGLYRRVAQLCREAGAKRVRVMDTPFSGTDGQAYTISGIEDAVKMANGSVIYTKVGSPVVARVMMDKGGVFGGEENGGLIFANFQYCRDGAMAVAKMLEIVAKRGKLSEINDRIPQYCQCKKKTACPEDKKQKVLSELAKARGLIPPTV